MISLLDDLGSVVEMNTLMGGTIRLLADKKTLVVNREANMKQELPITQRSWSFVISTCVSSYLTEGIAIIVSNKTLDHFTIIVIKYYMCRRYAFNKTTLRHGAVKNI